MVISMKYVNTRKQKIQETDMQFSSGWDVKVYCNILTTNDESIVTKVAKPSYYYNINQLCSSSSRRNEQINNG